jgi:hypothetical protein
MTEYNVTPTAAATIAGLSTGSVVSSATWPPRSSSCRPSATPRPERDRPRPAGGSQAGFAQRAALARQATALATVLRSTQDDVQSDLTTLIAVTSRS